MTAVGQTDPRPAASNAATPVDAAVAAALREAALREAALREAALGPSWRVVAEVLCWFAAALALRAGLAWALDFDGLWGQDAWGYLDQAQAILTWLGGGPLPVARWPQGYPALAVAVHGFGVALPAALQQTSLLCGAITVPLVWLAGRAWFPEPTPAAAQSTAARGAISGLGPLTAPRLAALLVACAPVHVLWSMCATSDAAAGMWLTMTAWMLGRSGATRHPSAWMVGVGAALAMALATRLACGLVAPALLVTALWQGRRPGFRGVQVALIALVVVLSLQVVLWLKAPTTSVIHPWLVGWRPWHAWQRSFETVDGAASYLWPQAVFAAFPAIHPGYLGGFGGLAALVGIATLRQRPAPTRALLVGWVATVWLFFAGMPYQNYRFGLVALMPWALLAGAGAVHLARKRRALAVVLVVATLAVQGVWAERLIGRHVTMAAQRTAAARSIDQLLPKDAIVIAFGLTGDLAGRSGRAVIELANNDGDALARLLPSKSPVFLVLDAGQVRRQWQGKPPAIHLAWLRQHAAVAVVDHVGRWGVWQVRR